MVHPYLLCLFVFLAVCCREVVPEPQSYGKLGSDLGIRVFQQVSALKPRDNLVLSPYGVANVLGMLLPGADGGTRRQLLTALRYKKNVSYSKLKQLHKNLTMKSNQDILTIASALFIQQGVSIKENFLLTNKDTFQSETRNMDFSDTQRAAAVVNNWVKNRTKGLIPTLIKPDMLDAALTRLLAVNSIYFKGLWKSRFQPENTKMRTFYRDDGTDYKTPMMSQLSVFNMGQASTPDDHQYKVIELPYHGNRIRMLIALPAEEETPISAIIPHISTATVQNWTKILTQRKVRLLLPRFSAEAEVDLEEPLSALGITDMFHAAKANFRNISTEHLYVSRALQKAKIEVNEDGTKAAAATTAILLARSSPPWVIVDRPFLFLIQDKPTGTILFMGKINEP